MTNETKQQLVVWWVLWAPFQVGIFIFHHFLTGNATPRVAPPPDSPVWVAGLAPFIASTIVRWILLPRAKSAQAALPLFIVGLALAEVTCMLGIFIFRTHSLALFAVSVLGIFQFIPFFARRYFPDDDEFPRG